VLLKVHGCMVGVNGLNIMSLNCVPFEENYQSNFLPKLRKNIKTLHVFLVLVVFIFAMIS
jgi:hypothetical protein